MVIAHLNFCNLLLAVFSFYNLLLFNLKCTPSNFQYCDDTPQGLDTPLVSVAHFYLIMTRLVKQIFQRS